MLSPYIVEESQQRHQERIVAANAWRLEQAARAERPAQLVRLRVALGARLIALGGWLQSNATMPVIPAGGEGYSSVRRIS